MTNFLADLSGLEYRTLSSNRSATSAFHNNEDSFPTIRHLSVTSFMKEMGNLRRPTPRYNFTWGIEQVFKHGKLGLKLLSLKLAMLLVLAAKNRG